jgi:polysaccharide export outer membrane protein
MAGDLNITALRNNILLIRNFNGQKKTYRVDMTRQDIFHSADLCYLRQGDIIYVEPNRSQRNSGAINSKIGILLSITTVILTSISLLTR